MEQTTLKPLDNEGVKTAVIVEQAAAPANEADADLTLCTDDQLPLTDGQKESIKITATYFNNLAVGIAVVGGVTPLLALFFSGSGLMGGDPLKVTVLCGTLIAAVIFSPEFHWDARRALAKLDGKDAVPPKSEELSFKAAARRVRNVAIGFSAILVGVSSVSYAISLTIKATATG